MTAISIDLEKGRQAVALAKAEWGQDALLPIGPHLSALLPLEPASDLERRWHVVQTLSQQEGNVAGAIRKVKMDGYDPREPKSVRVNSVRRRVVWRPMLVGYVFAGFDPRYDNWEQIIDIRGVMRLFMFNLVPLPVPDAAIERIRQREFELSDGGLSRPLASLLPAQVNDWVQIIDHPSFSGLLGIVIEVMPAKWRLIVEVDIFGQKVPVELSADQVRLAA
jgi:transcription antitermination factor NusG